MVLSIVGLKIYTEYKGGVLYSFTEDLNTDTYKANDFYVEIVTEKYWYELSGVGVQYDGFFYNNSKVDIVDWQVEFIVPENSTIDSSWSGIYNQSGDRISVRSVDYNTNITPEIEEVFGLVVLANKLSHVDTVIVSGYKDYKMTDFALFRILELVLLITSIVFLAYLVANNRMKKMVLEQEKDKKIIMQSLKTFANIIDAKDPYTKGHSLRVAIYSQEIARRMGKSEDEQNRIYQISLLHDIGKMGVANAILNKPGKLSQEEYKEVQRHTMTGGDILKDFTAIEGIEDGARYHHEMIDGTGYPQGLKGRKIPECARIICVADAFDAMNTDRCYRDRLPRTKIIDELKDCCGSQFDSTIVAHMLAMIEDNFDEEI